VALYRDWAAARKPVEPHFCSKRRHGFGMKRQHLLEDRWVECSTAWLEVQGFIKM
jgi:hypothetical protein